MTLLADEGVDRQIVERLRNEGYIVAYVSEMSPGTTDDLVLSWAKSERSVLVTQGKDFGELIYRKRMSSAGVVLLRLAGCSPELKAEIVSMAFRAHQNELPLGFTVITRTSIRIRRRPPGWS